MTLETAGADLAAVTSPPVDTGEAAVAAEKAGRLADAGSPGSRPPPASAARRLRSAGAASDRRERLLGDRMLRSFVGLVPTPALLAAVAAGRAAGVTLFRSKNISTPAQVRALTAALQAARPRGAAPLLIGVDQEGGQLQAIGDGATAWPGNLALAAAGSTGLARRAGVALGLELRAMGINVDFAPVCDLLSDARSPVMGTRTFGDDAAQAGRLAAAMVRGLQSTGVAATLKHFPGHGSVAGDSHEGLPISSVDGATLRSRELAPFRAGIRAGARLVMLAHLAVPAMTDGRVVPATLAFDLARTLLRDELGFEGVSLTDALDMGAIGPPDGLPGIAVHAATAGVDLLLTVHDPALEDRALAALGAALQDGRLDPSEARTSARRVRRLRRWLGRHPERPDLDVVGCSEHADLARVIAERSTTLLRDRAGLVPFRPGSEARVIVVAPSPVDLTPADTSSYLRLGLAGALRNAGLRVDDFLMPMDPSAGDIVGLRATVRDADLTIVCTVDALSHPGQARLVEALAADGVPTVAVALRTPFDLLAYPGVGTAAASYGIQAPNLDALAAALLGQIPFRGRLPVRLDPDLPGVGR